MNAALDAVLRHSAIWRGNRCAQVSEDTIATGFPALDAALPGGGWPRGVLTEILSEQEGIGELRLLMPALAKLADEAERQVWIAPPHIPYAPALAASGVQLEQMLVVDPHSSDDAWWAAEQALRSGACGAVLAWLSSPDERRLRRLQLAAEEGRGWGVLFRPGRAAQERSPAALRLRLEAASNGLAVHVLKRRGGVLAKPVVLDWRQAGSSPRLPGKFVSLQPGVV